MNSGTVTFDLRLVIAGVFFLAGASKLTNQSVDEQLWLLDAIGIPANSIIRAAVRSLQFIEICGSDQV